MRAVLKDILQTVVYILAGLTVCSIGQVFNLFSVFITGVFIIASAPYNFLGKYGENERKIYVQDWKVKNASY